MHALSLYHPYAMLMAIGAKRWETRPFRISKKHGAMAIAATARTPLEYSVLLKNEPFKSALERAGVDVDRLPLGCIVAVGTPDHTISTTEWIRRHCRRRNPMKYRDEQEYQFGDYAPKRYATFFPAVTRLEVPVPCRGAQGIWPVPADIEAQVRAQLERQSTPEASK